MSRRRFLQNKKLDAIPLVCPEDFETNIQSYLAEEKMANIVKEFDNIQYSNKKYCYAVHNDIPRYYNASSTYKQVNEHFLPNTSGIAIVSETLENGEVLKNIITLTSGTRSKYEFKPNSTHRWVCICQDSLNGYIPMDTKWYFLGVCNSVTRPEYYSNYSTTGANATTYNTINYCHIRASLNVIPSSFMYQCSNLKGRFVCTKDITTISYEAFHYSSINDIVLPNDNDSKLTLIGERAFDHCENLKYPIDIYIPINVTTVSRRAFAGKVSTGADVLDKNIYRIPPTLDEYSAKNGFGLLYAYDAYSFCKHLIISGIYYDKDIESSWGSTLKKCERIDVEGVVYSDLIDGIQPEGTVPYGTLKNKITINGKEYDNRYYIGNDRALHWVNADTIENATVNVLIRKPLNISNTDYAHLIDEGTTYIESYAFYNIKCTYENDSIRVLDNFLPNSIQKLKISCIFNFTNIKIINPFFGKNNLEYIHIDNANVYPDAEGYIDIPKNCSFVTLSINSQHKGYRIDANNQYLFSYDGCLYTKVEDSDTLKFSSIPKGWNFNEGVLHIHENCIYVPRINSISGIKEVYFEQSDNLEVTISKGLAECNNLTYIYLSNNIKSDGDVYIVGISNSKLKELEIPNKLKASSNYHLIGPGTRIEKFKQRDISYDDSDFIVIDDKVIQRYNGFLNLRECNHILIASPNTYINIPEGINGIGNYITSNFDAFTTYSNKQINIVFPTTLNYIDRLGSSNESLFPEIHSHKITLPLIYSSLVDTKLTLGTSTRPYRICRVPINAIGYDGTTYTEKESYIWGGSWCNPINTTAKQISELRFDLVKLSGNILNYNGQESFTLTQIGDEVATLPTDAYNYDHLKTITVPINTDGAYEVWVKNVEYSINNSDTNKITPISTQITKQIENINGVTTDIVTIDFGNETPTHEKIINITL